MGGGEEEALEAGVKEAEVEEPDEEVEVTEPEEMAFEEAMVMFERLTTASANGNMDAENLIYDQIALRARLRAHLRRRFQRDNDKDDGLCDICGDDLLMMVSDARIDHMISCAKAAEAADANRAFALNGTKNNDDSAQSQQSVQVTTNDRRAQQSDAEPEYTVRKIISREFDDEAKEYKYETVWEGGAVTWEPRESFENDDGTVNQVFALFLESIKK